MGLYIYKNRPTNLCVVDWNGEGDAGGDLHGVDADGLAVKVDERPARVAEGDGRVRLQVLGNVAVPQAQLGAGAAHGTANMYRGNNQLQ